MKLYFFPIAPNPTRVRLYLAEKALAGRPPELEEETVSLPAGEQKGEAHLQRNPAGKLPVLELDDGSFLTESTAIVEYLEELTPDPPMIGTTPGERARVRELDRIADLGVLMPMAGVVHATNSPLGLPPSPALAEARRLDLARGLARLEAVLADGRRFLAGAAPSIADCTLAAGLQFGRFGKVEFEAGPHLRRWDASYRERAPAQQVLLV